MRESDAERDIDRRTPEEIAASLRDVIAGATLLVGAGQYSPYAGHVRVTILMVDDENPRQPTGVWDRFFLQESIRPLCNALGMYARHVREGEVDTMYATGWSYAWTGPSEPLRVYDKSGLLAFVRENALHLRDRANIALSEIERVVGWLSADWFQRGVSVVLRQGERIVLAEVEEWAVHDPTYDGIDLMCDASWIGRVGKTVAKGLGVPYEAEDRALE